MVRFLLLPLSALAVGGDVTYKVKKRNKQWFLFCFLLLRSAPGLLSSPWFSVLSFFRSQTWRLRKEGWRLEADRSGICGRRCVRLLLEAPIRSRRAGRLAVKEIGCCCGGVYSVETCEGRGLWLARRGRPWLRRRREQLKNTAEAAAMFSLEMKGEVAGRLVF